MESSFTFFRVRGIPIGAHWSWLLIFGYIVWAWAGQVFPSAYPGFDVSTYRLMAAAAGVVFFVSLLLHELGHALRALREGMEIDGITLWALGGVAKFKGMFPSAGAEFRIAIAGPLVTLVLAAVFGGATAVLNGLKAPAAIGAVTDYLWQINTILLVFNMIPALPLDGGRVLRAYLWHRQANFAAATVSAARAGRAFGAVLLAVGVLGFFTQAGPQAFLFVFLGWFLMQAAQAEVAYARFSQALGGLHVRDLMTSDPEFVEPDRSILEFIEDVAHARGHSTFPVMAGPELAGLMSLRRAARVPPEQRPATTVGDVMLPRDDVPIVTPDTDVTAAALKLQEGPGRVLVVDDGRVVGILSGSDVARALELEQIRGQQPAAAAGRRGPWLVWVLVGVVILAAGGFLLHPPVAVIAPGTSFDVSGDITIRGIPVDPVHGKYLLTSVSLGQPSGLGLAWALAQGRDIVPLSAIIPRGVDPDRYFQQQRTLFRETEMVSAAAAARAAGMNVTFKGTGARVVSLVRGSPAAKVLRVGDVITAVNGRPVRLADDVGRVVRSRPSGTQFVLTVERDGRKRDVKAQSRPGIVEGQPGIGVSIETRDFDIDLPFRIRFKEREIGGPSAGLTYALAVYDMLVDRDLARGRAVATTGTIDLNGRVGPVGGVEEKAIAAREAGAQLMLVPQQEVEQARGAGLEVLGVASLSEALRVLA